MAVAPSASPPRPLRILLAHALYPPEYAGGGEYVVHEIAKGLRARGAEVRVITTGDPAHNLIDGVPVQRLPVSKYRFNFAVRAIAREAKNADLIQTFNYHACAPAWLAGKLTGKPVVCTIMGFFGSQWRKLRGPIAGTAWALWERMLLRIPYDATVFMSDFSKQRAEGIRIPDERTLVCNPGISIEHYYAAEKQDEVLFVGKLEARKGVDTILAVARMLPHVNFRIIGWGDHTDAYRRGAPDNVRFQDFERGQAHYDALARARIFLFPSHAETFGLAPIEAMASGCAIISSLPMPFEGERITAGDSAGIAAAVEKLWTDRTLTTNMGRKNVHLAQQYTWERHINALWQRYEKVLEQRSHSTPQNALGEHS